MLYHCVFLFLFDEMTRLTCPSYQYQLFQH